MWEWTNLPKCENGSNNKSTFIYTLKSKSEAPVNSVYNPQIYSY